ncbi:Rib/alpha-like domain-containing protein, partial [Enterococcus gallinarum]
NPIPTIGEDQILPEEVYKGEEVDLTDNIINLPEGSKVEVVTPVDTDQVGEQTGEVKVTFPDGSSVVVEIPVMVKDNVATNKQNLKEEGNPIVIDITNSDKSTSISKNSLKVNNKSTEINNKVLPKTGENNTPIFSILGMALISFTGLLFKLFKKE